MSDSKIEYKLFVSKNPSIFTQGINEYIQDGWEPVGSHQVVVLKTTNRFAGSQLRDSFNDVEYSQTLIRKSCPKEIL
jgi:hypothetical protein